MNSDNKVLLDRYLVKFPKVSLLISKSDVDKSDSVLYLAQNLSVELVDITNEISYDFLNDLYLRSDNAIYKINLDDLSMQKQNVVLKFIEEPPTRSYVVLTAVNKQILPTILTRCVVFELHKYTKNELREHCNDDLLLSISETIDDINTFDEYDLKSLWNLCNNICENISRATLPNALSISSKYIWLKDKEPNKYSLEVFVAMMTYFLQEKFVQTNSKIVYLLYMKLLELNVKLLNKSLSREHLLSQFFIDLRNIVKGVG